MGWGRLDYEQLVGRKGSKMLCATVTRLLSHHAPACFSPGSGGQPLIQPSFPSLGTQRMKTSVLAPGEGTSLLPCSPSDLFILFQSYFWK